METAASRIRTFHEGQRAHEAKTFSFTDADGCALGTRVLPVARVGVYAPGGKARYPSSVLMAAIPARVAGVGEIACWRRRWPEGAGGEEGDRPTLTPIYAAAHLSHGVTAILDAGGAHAIGALAYGTRSVPRVDKIVGPGNACVRRLRQAARVRRRRHPTAWPGPSENPRSCRRREATDPAGRGGGSCCSQGGARRRGPGVRAAGVPRVGGGSAEARGARGGGAAGVAAAGGHQRRGRRVPRRTAWRSCAGRASEWRPSPTRSRPST